MIFMLLCVWPLHEINVFWLSQTLARVAFLQVLVSGYTPCKLACNQQVHGGGMETYQGITRWLPRCK